MYYLAQKACLGVFLGDNQNRGIGNSSVAYGAIRQIRDSKVSAVKAREIGVFPVAILNYFMALIGRNRGSSFEKLIIKM